MTNLICLLKFDRNILARFLKFKYSEKATQFCEIFTLLLSYVVPVKSKVKISQNFVAFSEYLNFKISRDRLMLGTHLTSGIKSFFIKNNKSISIFRCIKNLRSQSLNNVTNEQLAIGKSINQLLPNYNCY